MVFFDKYQKDSGKNIQRFQNDTLKASAYLAIALMKKILKGFKQDNLGEVEIKVDGKTVFQASLNQEKLELKTNKFSHQELKQLNQAFSKFSQNERQPPKGRQQSQPALLPRAGVSNSGEKFPPQIEVLVDGDKEVTLSPEQTQTLIKLMGSLRGNNLEKTNGHQASRDQTSPSPSPQALTDREKVPMAVKLQMVFEPGGKNSPKSAGMFQRLSGVVDKVKNFARAIKDQAAFLMRSFQNQELNSLPEDAQRALMVAQTAHDIVQRYGQERGGKRILELKDYTIQAETEKGEKQLTVTGRDGRTVLEAMKGYFVCSANEKDRQNFQSMGNAHRQSSQNLERAEKQAEIG